MTTAALPIRCWKFTEWPDLDQQTWIAGCAPASLFEGPRPGAAWREATRTGVMKGYGRWLCFLARTGQLEPDTPPLARVSENRVLEYWAEMRDAGNADSTIIGRIGHLAMALGAMNPGADIGWIRKIGDETYYRLLRNRRRQMQAPDADVLFDWGVGLMDEAQSARQNDVALRQFRDGLLIAMFASRGRRLRSMSLVRVGLEMRRGNDGYRIDLTRDQVKTDQADSFDLPACLVPYIEHYLRVVRPALVRGQYLTALWVKAGGGALSSKGIQTMIGWRSKARFGYTFGPHRFRHAIVTTATLKAPEHPGLGAQLLGISEAVARQHYTLASTNHAVGGLDDLIATRRRELGIPHGLPPLLDQAPARGRGRGRTPRIR